jgi:hypothetical protein
MVVHRDEPEQMLHFTASLSRPLAILRAAGRCLPQCFPLTSTSLGQEGRSATVLRGRPTVLVSYALVSDGSRMDPDDRYIHVGQAGRDAGIVRAKVHSLQGRAPIAFEPGR